MVIANRTERIMARRQVNALILADPVTITPVRRESVDDGAGGFTLGDSTPMSPVEVLLTAAKRRLSSILVNTEMGDVPDYPFLILARDGADLKRGDFFVSSGDQYEIKSIHLDEGVSVTAQVDYFGGATNG